MSRIEYIAKGLTRAQREYLTERAQWHKPAVWASPRWMTFPPPATHRVLQRLGLVNSMGILQDDGLAVRDYLNKGD